jgi:hypothetical protein
MADSEELVKVAALYVDPRGPYPKMPGVECWDEARDARTYPGPHPVVAHPPCARWCRLAKFVETQYGHRVGDDGGMFGSALAAVRRWGGVLEHPAETLAFAAFDIPHPNRRGGWQRTMRGEWVCQVAQGAYGHPNPKKTWLVLVGGEPPETDWGVPELPPMRSYTAGKGRLTGRDRITGEGKSHITPQPFADFLVALARGVKRRGLSRTDLTCPGQS